MSTCSCEHAPLWLDFVPVVTAQMSHTANILVSSRLGVRWVCYTIHLPLSAQDIRTMLAATGNIV